METCSTDAQLYNTVVHASRQLASWSVMYICGYFGFSFGWIFGFLLLDVIRFENVNKLKVARQCRENIGQQGEKEVILSRVSELPAWVFFPDFERAEWVNRMVSQLWPSISHYATHLLQVQAEPIIRENLETYSIREFKFSRVSLGNLPPRIGGIKCYDKAIARNEIIMDAEICWAGDCDVEVSIKGMRASILDLYLHGTLRVILKPLIQQLPLVGGLQVYFLDNPSLDFHLGGVANIADMPGVSSVLRRVICEQIAAVIVLPNKVSVKLVEDIPMKVFKCPEPEGVLRVRLVEARNLMEMDLNIFGLQGKSDPYAIMSVGAKEYRSSIVKNTVDPVWEEEWEVIIEVARGQILHVNLWDYDQGLADEFLGRISIPVSALVSRAETDLWVNLEEATKGRIRLKTEWFVLSTERCHYEERKREVHGKQLSTAVLLVYIDSCKQLPLSKPSLTKPDPVVEVSITGRNAEESFPVLYTRNPVYEQGFALLVHNPEVDELHVRVYDFKSKFDLGFLRISLADLMRRKGMEYFNQPFKLQKSGVESSITLHIQMLFTKKSCKHKHKLTKDESVDIPNEVANPDILGTEESVVVEAVQQLEVEQVELIEQAADEAVEAGPEDVEVVLTNVEEEAEGREDIIYEDVLVQRTSVKSTNPCVMEAESSGSSSILLSVNYSAPHQVLSVGVHRATHLLQGVSFQLRLSLLPNRPAKRKTSWQSREEETVTWEEEIFFSVTESELREKFLDLSIFERRNLFAKSTMMYRSSYSFKRFQSDDCPKKLSLTLIPVIPDD